MDAAAIPVTLDDPVNRRILAVSEDRVQGFHAEPFAEIARLAGVPEATVLDRLRAMLAAGLIRRIRQTLLATNLAPGALVAWQVPDDRLDAAFDLLAAEDPFTGHVVIRTTDPGRPGADYRLWTTLKVPRGISPARHCQFLRGRIGAADVRLMPARKVFALGVGHVRRMGLAVGSMDPQPAEPMDVTQVEMTDLDQRVVEALRREFTADEIAPDPWRGRAAQAGVALEQFVAVARSLAQRGVIGRFSTFLEHSQPVGDGPPVSRHNGLFHWAVPPGREVEAGRQVGRFHVMTHAYWRDGGAAFGHVNIMGVAHGNDRDLVLAHKRAIDEHLAREGVPLLYTNVFWGVRSRIKPSEISAAAYEQWCARMGVAVATLREP